MNVGIDKTKLMDGRPPARRVLAEVARKIERIRSATGVTPALATLLVGDDPASAAYVRMKRKRCDDVGMKSLPLEMPPDITTEQLIAKIKKLAIDSSIHGIIVQHPVRGPIDRRAVFEAIPPAKDVDGVTSSTMGRVILGMPAFAPCTPTGIMRLLREYNVDFDGADAVVIGRSPILGRPMASMLINAHATVTLSHSRTRDLPSLLRRADILIVAIGRPRYVQGDWIKPGAVVIDAGYNEGNIGDVDFDGAVQVARLITPVPGGVGPMTVAALIEQTAHAAAMQLGVEL